MMTYNANNQISKRTLSCIDQQIFNVGKIIKSTKKMYQWTFTYDNIEHKLKLYVSKLTDCKKLVLNERILFPKQKVQSKLTVRFQLYDDFYAIEQKGGQFFLTINSISFSNMIGNMKCPTPQCYLNSSPYENNRKDVVVLKNSNENDDSPINKRYSAVDNQFDDNNDEYFR